ncbi:PREDICTED: spindle pole body component 110-like, partial [Amphimedon queenslandica]|uniref:Uncharacterized protein n=2 Tax=Amphimedon queenslandica TaxID=400682 RepID=A0AAN0JYE8_AMPQE
MGDESLRKELEERTREVGRYKIHISEINKENKKLKRENDNLIGENHNLTARIETLEKQCAHCRGLMAKQVAQRPDAAYTPSLMHEMKDKAATTEEANRELKLQVEQLKKKLDESQNQEAYLSERLDGLEYQYNQVTSGKDSNKEKLSSVNEELRLLKISHDEQKEDYEIEISKLKCDIKERYDEQKEREEKWKSRESDLLLKNAGLEGDYRSVYNELLEYKNKTSSSGSIDKEAATQS